MTPMKAISLITRREIRSRVFSKAFTIGLVVTVVLIFAVFGLGRLLSSDDPVEVGLLGPQPPMALSNLEAIAAIDGTEIELTNFDTRSDAEEALEAGDVEAVVVDGSEILMDRQQAGVVALLTPAWQQAGLIDGLASTGLSSGDIDEALASARPLEVTELNPDPESDAREQVAFATVVLLFISVQIAGAYIMMGVFEEKTTKVVELVLSSIPARYLLIGKVLGVGLLGLIQVAVLAASGVIAASIFGSSALPALSVSLIATGFLWFVLGYLLYGALFAAGASLAPRQEDAQATLAPVSIILMLSYFASIFVAAEPTSTAARVVSWLPFTAPFTMPGRLATGDAVWWEVVGSMVLTALAAGAVLFAAERIYVRSVIHTDRKLGWKEAWSLQA